MNRHSIRNHFPMERSLHAERQPVPRYVHEEPQVEVVPESRVASALALAAAVLCWGVIGLAIVVMGA